MLHTVCIVEEETTRTFQKRLNNKRGISVPPTFFRKLRFLRFLTHHLQLRQMQQQQRVQQPSFSFFCSSITMRSFWIQGNDSNEQVLDSFDGAGIFVMSSSNIPVLNMYPYVLVYYGFQYCGKSTNKIMINDSTNPSLVILV